MQHIDTKLNHADLLTKHLDDPLYTFHRNKTMNID